VDALAELDIKRACIAFLFAVKSGDDEAPGFLANAVDRAAETAEARITEAAKVKSVDLITKLDPWGFIPAGYVQADLKGYLDKLPTPQSLLALQGESARLMEELSSLKAKFESDIAAFKKFPSTTEINNAITAFTKASQRVDQLKKGLADFRLAKAAKPSAVAFSCSSTSWLGRTLYRFAMNSNHNLNACV